MTCAQQNSTQCPAPPVPLGGQLALQSAADFIKYTLAFSVGSLVFSVALINKLDQLAAESAVSIFLSWVLLSVSTVGGVLAYARIPTMLAEENHNLEDGYFIWPGRVHQVAFILGVLAIGFTLSSELYANVSKDDSSTTVPKPEGGQADELIHQGARILREAVASLERSLTETREDFESLEAETSTDVNQVEEDQERFADALATLKKVQEARWDLIRSELLKIEKRLNDLEVD